MNVFDEILFVKIMIIVHIFFQEFFFKMCSY